MNGCRITSGCSGLRAVICYSWFHALRAARLAPALGALLFFFGIVSFILLRYPGSLTDRSRISVRGVVSGIIMFVTLEGAMLT
jgi:hypothetical protein